MSNTSRWFGFTIVNGLRQTARLAGLCARVPAQWLVGWSLRGPNLRLRGARLFQSSIGIETVKRMLTGVVTASALLHFYYDGFIWKLREKSTRQSLGIGGGTADVATNSFLPSWALHGAKWVAAFIIPLGAFWVGQVRTVRSELERLSLIVTDVPASSRAHSNYGTALQEAGRLDAAADEFSTALHFNPSS